MSKYNVMFKTMDDIEEFVERAGKCDFDIDIKYNHILIDAKSILGILSIGLGRSMDVICHMYNEEFENYLRTFRTAA